MMATEIERTLANAKELKLYLESLPLGLELRFPSITSTNGKFADNIIPYDINNDTFLFGAYDTLLSNLPKDTITIESEDGTLIDFVENEYTLFIYGLTKETGLIPGMIKWLGVNPKKVKNTNPAIDEEFHYRYYGLAYDFKGTVKVPDPLLNSKIKEFVWIKISLLPDLFEAYNEMFGKAHPQIEAYRRFLYYKEANPVSFSDMLKEKIKQQ